MEHIATLRKQNIDDATQSQSYDVAIIGGGLAGLSTAIQCMRAGHSTILFEKEKFPFHRVCGEYISLESWDFLEEMGVALSEMNLPIIRKLQVSAPNGKLIEQMLPLGGFGISRYKLDGILAENSIREGVKLMENTKVEDVVFEEPLFRFRGNAASITAKVVVAAFGKRSNMDVKWKRPFANRKNNKHNNYVGVKYHVKTNQPADTIALHNFSDGYCGISRVEDEKSCLCYLTTANNLRKSGNSITELEKRFLKKNPYLNEIFSNAEFLFETPLTISQISFEKKSQVEDHILMTGDAAGMIAPLCGNGMSMALHGSKLLFEEISRYLQHHISRAQMEENYTRSWQKHFQNRLATGRIIQRFFGSPTLSNLLVSGLKPFPGVVNRLISATHGQPF